MPYKSIALALALSAFSLPAWATCPSSDFTFNYHTAAISAASGTTTDANGNSFTYSIPAVSQGSDVASTTLTLTPVSCSGGAAPVVVSSNHTSCDSGTSGTTCATSGTQAALTAGDYAIVSDGSCSDGACTGSANTNHVTSVAGSGILCPSTASAGDSTSHLMRSDIWLCLVTASGSPTITATYNAGQYWKTISVMDVRGLRGSPDDGKGNVAYGTGSSPVVALSAASTQANELITYNMYCSGGATPTTPTGFTALSSNLSFYETTNATGTNSTTNSCSGNGTAPWAASISAFKIP